MILHPNVERELELHLRWYPPVIKQGNGQHNTADDVSIKIPIDMGFTVAKFEY